MVAIENLLSKRSWYAALGRAIGTGIVVSTKNISTGVATVTCSSALIAWIASAPLSAGLAISCAASTVIATVSSAAYQALHQGGIDITGKRELYELYSHPLAENVMVNKLGYAHGYAVDSASIMDEYNDRANDAGLELLGIIRNVHYVSHVNGTVLMTAMSASSKPDMAAYSDSVAFSSKYGNHVAIGGHNASDLINKILDYSPNDTKAIEKRGGYYIDWVLYSYDNVNRGLTQAWYDTDGEFGIYELTDEGLKNIDSNMGQKLCATSFSCPKAYEICSASTAENNNAFHGEVYWNAYGGVDGFCNQNNDDT